jgi:transcriptional regulator with XRE-family HTH domain
VCSNMLMKNRNVDGGKLRALRVATGVHMRDVAAAVGCSYRHLQMIEAYGRQPGPELVYRLARELSRLRGHTVTIGMFTSPAEEDEAA